MRAKLKLLAHHEDFTPQAELQAAHTHAVNESEAFKECEAKLRYEEQCLASVKKQLGFDKLSAEVNAVSSELREAHDVRYSAMAMLDQSLAAQWRVDMEEQSLMARFRHADNEAEWALSLKEHVDKQHLQLRDTIEWTITERQLAEEDHRHAEMEMNAARDSAVFLTKFREEIKHIRRRLDNERRRCYEVCQENDILKGELRDEVHSRQQLEDAAISERDVLRAQLRDALMNSSSIAIDENSVKSSPGTSERGVPDNSLKARRSKASADRNLQSRNF